MSISPLQDADGPLRIVVSAGGVDLDDTAALISATVRHAVNEIPSATLVFSDGDLPSQSFPLGDSDRLQPGTDVTVKAGYGSQDVDIVFSGIVVRQGLAIDGDQGARLTIDCRDQAIRMTVGRRSACHADQTDAQVLSSLVTEQGLSADVSDAALHHEQLVRHDCSDWDFLLARAAANGCLVAVRGGKVCVAEPDTDAAPALKVTYGTDLIEFEGELDARDQVAEMTARAWDAGTQSLLEGAAARPAPLNRQGDPDPGTLARVLDVGTLSLQTGAAMPEQALDAWAKARQRRSGLSRLRGRMRFQGSAKAGVGNMVELAGVGRRFSGPVLVTGVTHHFARGDWTTELAFGLPPEAVDPAPQAAGTSAAGALPGIQGLQVGVVRQLDADPTGAHRIRVGLPAAGVDGVWARLMQFSASKGFGAFFVPEVGDEVLLGFLDDDPGSPVVLGSLYSRPRAPAPVLTAGNAVKSLTTRCGARLEFNDEDRLVAVATPGGRRVLLSDRDRAIELTDPDGNRVRLDPSGIRLDSPKDVRIDAKGSLTLSAVGALTLDTRSDLRLKGLNVQADAQVALTARGSASAELSASGTTTVKGVMVMIN